MDACMSCRWRPTRRLQYLAHALLKGGYLRLKVGQVRLGPACAGFEAAPERTA